MVVQAQPSYPAALAALDLHEGIGDIGGEGCGRWPENFWLQSTLEHLVRGRCKATNLCPYCARLAAVENSELLALDATEGVAPEVWMVLGTGTDELRSEPFYAARKHLMKAIRREFAGRSIEWAALVEFTTGYSLQSEGRRFPHWNVLLKGVYPDDIPTLRRIVDRVWCGRDEFKAVPSAQVIAPVSEAGGLMRYIALHFQKESQAPPAGWRGHRFLKSRAYLWTDTPTARHLARQALLLKRELWRAHHAGLRGQAADDAAHLALYERNELAWTLMRTVAIPTAYDVAGEPTAWSPVLHPVGQR